MKRDDLELLKALVVLAAADDVIAKSERGLLERLCVRVGVGRASLDAMIERAMSDHTCRQELFIRTTAKPELAMELLVAAARIDGEIDERERAVLVDVMGKLKIPVDRFSELYQRGIDRADTIRKSRSSE